MNVKSIRDFCERKPFQRFEIRFSDGRSIPVEQPDFVLYPPTPQEIIVYQPDLSFDFIDVFSITSLKSRRPQPKTGKKES